jgi:hypothetical protein
MKQQGGSEFTSLQFSLLCGRSLESLVDGHNWVLNQFVEIPLRSIIVCYLSLLAKAGIKPPTIWDQP